ncbi:GNAT family N-acetyltransferase [Metaclostridioides mangenotii]|uniref:GNAT family N-acetyltransferase n=1 Tax=Metaclostridioides mangenotii TaxID=1540 RepID=UPI002F41A4B9
MYKYLKGGYSILINKKYANKDNWHDLISLSVKEDQSQFIESNLLSIAESKFEKSWKPVGIYDGDTLIGFAMYGKLEYENRVWLDRFMIDYRSQNKGYGRASLDFLINSLIKEYNCNEIYLSIYEENSYAIKLYKSVGFNFNQEVDDNGEKVMVLKLND